MIDLKQVQLHSPMFLAGTNLQTHLDITKRESLFVQYDDKKDMLVVWYKHQMALVPKENIVSMCPLEKELLPYKEPSLVLPKPKVIESAQPNLKIQAQVSTPQGHVFSETQGETGQSKIR